MENVATKPTATVDDKTTKMPNESGTEVVPNTKAVTDNPTPATVSTSDRTGKSGSAAPSDVGSNGDQRPASTFDTPVTTRTSGTVPTPARDGKVPASP
jgi:hypothetical protein